MKKNAKIISWTSQQSKAIAEHTRNVFVSASAGTGKTAVLSGRYVHAVKDMVSCPDVWSILVLTFTDMAAEQMRRRIAQQLKKELQATADETLRRHLRRQLVLLGAADVSTIHSFCKRIITEHFYLLDLDPTFRILDADESALLKTEILQKTIDWAWEQPNLSDAMSLLLSRRDLRTTAGFPATIIDISDFLDGVVSRDDWFEKAQLLAHATNPFDTDLAQSQRQIISEKLQDALARLEFALQIYNANNPTGPWADKCKNEYIEPVRRCIENFNSGRWEFNRPRVSKPADVSQPDLIAEIVGDALDTVKNLKDLAILNPGYLSKFSAAVSSQTMVLIELVKRFDLFYAQAKKTINCLDFADLEHLALRLLATKNNGKLEPSQMALALRKKYKYIFVDEYQDINGVQQAILDMLSSPLNFFAVGDTKQSIYQWRGANPDIFLDNLKRASIKPAGDSGLRVDLNVNFRSAKPILDFVNAVFGRIMTPSFTGIDYDQAAHLQPPAQSDDSVEPAPAVELHFLDESQKNADADGSNPDTAGFSNRQLQARLIANRIKQFVGDDKSVSPLQIFDKETHSERPAEYRDIVILMRSLAGKSDFVEALRLSGVPVSSESIAGYFETTEITDMLCLLKVLDNPRRDIEFAAVLRSPFFRFSDTELAKIRLLGKKDNHETGFYDCVLSCSQSTDDRDLASKINNALVLLDDWRTFARRGRLAELIWHIYRQTGYLAFVCALPDGPARKANLLKLHDRAVQFEGFAGSSGVPSLTRFVEFIEKLVAAGEDWSKPEPESPAGNTVRILSIHKSKGLEFPVVFIADLDGEFSKKDLMRDCLVDEQSTIGLRIIDADTNTRLDSLARQVIESRSRRKSLAEEMRVLYVAMTRAMDRLVLVGCVDKKKCQHLLTTSLLFEGQPVPHWHLASCKSHLDWLLSALGNNPFLHQSFQTGQSAQTAGYNLFTIQFYTQSELTQLSSLMSRPSSKRVTSDETRVTTSLARLKDALNWQYPFGNAPLLPAKRSVSQWTHRNDEFVKRDYSESISRKPKSILAAEPLDGKSIGSATHLVISRLDLNKPVSTEAIKRLIDKLTADGAITQPVASQVDAESIVRFFKTDLGRMALDKSNTIFREWPFTFAVPASQWTESDAIRNTQPVLSKVEGYASRDTIIIQGIIDLLIETPQGLIVVDFKSDDVSPEQLPHRVELYHPQLDLYARAASAITGQKTLSKWLYFLRPARAVEI